MESHKVTIHWERGDQSFEPEHYPRDHEWQFDGGERVKASAAAGFHGNPDCVDPEQAFTAALSACHMLTFLALASKKRIVVNAYDDQAEGFLGKNEDGRMAMVRVVLRPRIEFEGDPPDPEQLAQLHERAHKACFIANSVNTPVEIE
ncbi:MAG: OsmC family protein [Xanthomonadales bacterium]|nr:OsmC family protein [Xanthomonadales bacterium]